MGNPWLDHVKTVRKSPEAAGKTFKEVLILAKKSYKKVVDGVSEKIKPITQIKGVKKSRKASKKVNRKGSRKSRKSRKKSRKSRRR